MDGFFTTTFKSDHDYVRHGAMWLGADFWIYFFAFATRVALVGKSPDGAQGQDMFCIVSRWSAMMAFANEDRHSASDVTYSRLSRKAILYVHDQHPRTFIRVIELQAKS